MARFINAVWKRWWVKKDLYNSGNRVGDEFLSFFHLGMVETMRYQSILVILSCCITIVIFSLRHCKPMLKISNANFLENVVFFFKIRKMTLFSHMKSLAVVQTKR